jgi:hypothetical protein
MSASARADIAVVAVVAVVAPSPLPAITVEPDDEGGRA